MRLEVGAVMDPPPWGSWFNNNVVGRVRLVVRAYDGVCPGWWVRDSMGRLRWLHDAELER